MSEWDVFGHFALSFFVFCLVTIIAYILIRLAGKDIKDTEGLTEAEWIISDYCNSQKDCKKCKRYNKITDKCNYKDTLPGKWNFGKDDG